MWNSYPFRSWTPWSPLSCPALFSATWKWSETFWFLCPKHKRRDVRRAYRQTDLTMIGKTVVIGRSFGLLIFFFFFFLYFLEQLLLSLCDVVRLSVCPWQDTPSPKWILGSSGKFSYFHFFFYTFPDVSCHPECLKKISLQFFVSPKICLLWAVGEARRDTMLPNILVLSCDALRQTANQHHFCNDSHTG